VVRLQQEPIRVEEILNAVAAPSAGALALFLGTVRNENRGRSVTHLEYHAYDAMAEAEMARLVERASVSHSVARVAIVHRTGRLEIGEVSVAVAVAAAHRAAALDACRFVIDELKRTVPIWKREFYEGGSVWIERQA
jgi:molybdopterin synthase catalytic subunit